MSEWVKVCTRVALVSVLLQSCVQIRHRNRHSHRYRLRTDTEKDTDADTTFTQTQVVCVVPPPPADSSRKVLRTWSTGRGRSACPTVLRLCTRMSGQRRGCSIVATRGTFSSYLAQGCPCKVMFTGLWPLICFSMMSPLVLCIQRLQWVLLKVISLLDVFVCVRVCMMYLCGCVCMYLRISLVGCCAPGPVRPCACLSDCMYVCVYVCIFVRVCVLRMASREDIGNTSVLTQIPRNHGTITSIYQNIIWCRHYCGSFSFLMSYVYFCLCLSLCTFVPFLFSLSFKWCVGWCKGMCARECLGAILRKLLLVLVFFFCTVAFSIGLSVFPADSFILFLSGSPSASMHSQ